MGGLPYNAGFLFEHLIIGEITLRAIWGVHPMRPAPAFIRFLSAASWPSPVPLPIATRFMSQLLPARAIAGVLVGVRWQGDVHFPIHQAGEKIRPGVTISGRVLTPPFANTYCSFDRCLRGVGLSKACDQAWVA